MSRHDSPFVSRAGIKLAHALDTFAGEIAADGLRCADFGCNVGGFTDCLLQRGAAHVFSIDTAYGVLAWKLRNDSRVTVLERTNALHVKPPSDLVDLVVIDMAWTPQRLAIPAALRWLRPDGRIITLIKPHYELRAEEKYLLRNGFLVHDDARRVAERTSGEIPSFGARVLANVESPITGGKSAKSGGGTGNLEFLLLLAAA